MGQIVARGAVERLSVGEQIGRSELDPISSWLIGGMVVAIVDPGARVDDERITASRSTCLLGPELVGPSVDLSGTEDRIDAVDERPLVFVIVALAGAGSESLRLAGTHSAIQVDRSPFGLGA